MSTYLKAIATFLYVLASSLSLVSTDGIDLTEGLTSLAAALVGSGVVYLVPNRTPVDQPNDPNTSTQDTGIDTPPESIEAAVERALKTYVATYGERQLPQPTEQHDPPEGYLEKPVVHEAPEEAPPVEAESPGSVIVPDLTPDEEPVAEVDRKQDDRIAALEAQLSALRDALLH